MLRLGNRVLAPLVALTMMFSSSLSLIAQPVKALSLGLRIEYLGVLPALGFVVQVIVRPVASSLADKYGRKIVVVIGTFLAFVGLSLFFASSNLPVLILAYVISSQGFGIIWGPLTVMSAESHERKSQGVSKVQSSAMLGNFVGMLMSGFSFSSLGLDGTLLLSALCSSIPFALSLALRETIQVREKRLLSGIKTALKASVPTFLSISSLGMRPIIRLYGSALLVTAGVSPEVVGVIMMVDPLVTAVMQLPSERLYSVGFRRTEVLNSLAVLFAVAFIHAIFFSPAASMVFLALYSATSSMMITMQQSKLAEERRRTSSRVAGYDLAISMSRVLSSATVSYVSGYAGVAMGFTAISTVLLILSGAYGIRNKLLERSR